MHVRSLDFNKAVEYAFDKMNYPTEPFTASDQKYGGAFLEACHAQNYYRRYNLLGWTRNWGLVFDRVQIYSIALVVFDRMGAPIQILPEQVDPVYQKVLGAYALSFRRIFIGEMSTAPLMRPEDRRLEVETRLEALARSQSLAKNVLNRQQP